jgi:hypothetical protein
MNTGADQRHHGADQARGAASVARQSPGGRAPPVSAAAVDEAVISGAHARRAMAVRPAGGSAARGQHRRQSHAAGRERAEAGTADIGPRWRCAAAEAST